MSDETDDKPHHPVPVPSPGGEPGAPSVRLPDVNPDRQLRDLLRRWRVPEAPESLDVWVLASYRQLAARRPWWRRLLRLGPAAPKGSGAPPTLARRVFTAAGVLAAAVVVLAIQHKGIEPVSAAELLRDARRVERSLSVPPGHAVHRVLSLEERRIPDRTLISRRKVEVWQSGPQSVRRMFDSDGRLVAGEWTFADGSRTLYRPDAPPVRVAAPPVAGSAEASADEASRISRFDDFWRLDPSAASFGSLVEREDAATVELGAATVIVRAPVGFAKAEGAAATAGLTLRRQDRRALALTLHTSGRDGDRELIMTPLQTEQLAQAALPAGVFRRDATPLIAAPPAAAGPPPVKALTGAALIAAQVEALRLLHQAGACLQEQAMVTRTPSGTLRIQAIVANEERRRELRRALAPALNGAAARFELTTPSESLRHEEGGPGPLIIRELDVTNGEFPVYAELRRHFGGPEFEGAGGRRRADEEIRSFANEMLTGSRGVLLHAWALRHLLEPFAREYGEPLPPAALASWRSMIDEHARAVQQETARLRLQLAPVFEVGASIEPDSVALRELEPDDLAQAVGQLFELAAAHERAIRSAFVLSDQPREAVVIGSLSFHKSLRRAELVAAHIQSMRP